MNLNAYVRPLCSIAAIAMLFAATGCRHTAAGSTAPPLAQTERDAAYREIERLTEVIIRVKKNYVEEKTYEEIIDGALEGMLNSLDQHSHYLNQQKYKEMREETSGQFGGIGIWIGARDGFLRVIAPIEDTPAFRQGLMARDIIAKIGDSTTADMKLDEAVKLLRGIPGTTVDMTIAREGETKPLEVTIKREIIKVPSVKGTRMVRNGIGYVRITQFAMRTAASLKDALDELKAQNMEALILDLRSNPGGLLQSARDVSELFLEKGQLIVSVKGRDVSAEKRLIARGKDPLLGIPMAILINGGSASASEIVAGAMKDHSRAFLVGDKSFGKGSVQTVDRLLTDESSAIRITTAKYYTPKKIVIHDHGIEPDIKIPVTPAEWRKILTRRAHTEQPDSYTDKDKAEFADIVDVQLERAADVLTAMRILGSRE